MHIRGYPEHGPNINFAKDKVLNGGVKFESSYDIERSVVDGNLNNVENSPDFFHIGSRFILKTITLFMVYLGRSLSLPGRTSTRRTYGPSCTSAATTLPWY